MSETSLLWGTLKSVALTVAVVAGVGAVAYVALPKVLPMIGGPKDPNGSEIFNKTAYDENGVQLSGPVAVGQVIQYVLRYQRPTSGTSGPATINDTLSSNQTYVPNTINAPGWSYSTPEYGGNTETYSSPGIGPSSFTLTVPAMSGSMGAAMGGGDGYVPVPVVTSTGVKVFGINHHQPTNGDPHISCWYGGSLQKCSPSYPKLASNLPELRATPDLPHAAVLNKKVYYPTGIYPNVPLSTTNQTIEFGIACWDAELDMPCPFIPLPGHPSLSSGSSALINYLGTNIDPYLAGVVADPQNPSHMMIYAKGTVYCVDVALPGAPTCSGWTDVAVAQTNTAGRSTDMFVEEGGTRVFFSNTVPRIFCYNISDGSACSAWGTAGVSGGAGGATNLGAGINASGTMTAICLSRGFATTSGFVCVDIATATSTSSAWPATFLAGKAVFTAYHLPGTARVLFPNYTYGPPSCYDFSTSAGCAGFSPYWTSPGNVKDYGYAADPVVPDKCFYGLGDGGKLVRFDQNGALALSSCAPNTFSETFSTDDQYCFAKPTEASWTSVRINNRPSELTGGTIVLKDSAGTVIQTITVNASDVYALNLSALGLNSTVTLDFTPIYTGNPPTADYQLELTYSANEEPQICYQAKVTECGAVFNDAILNDDIGTYTARVDLGDTSGPCGGGEEEETCLHMRPSMVVNPDGSGMLFLALSGPPGFAPGLMTLEALSGGIGNVTPVQTFSQGQTHGSWALTGLVPGTVVSFRVSGVMVGGGSKPGSDQCCDSTFEITVPPVGTDDQQHETDTPPPPPPPPPVCDEGSKFVAGEGCVKTETLACDTKSTKRKAEACACRYEGMKQKSPTVCTCPAGTKLVAGEGCVKPPLVCDPWSAEAKNGVCGCLYQGMKRVSPTMCECAKDQILIKGVGCVKPKQTEKPAITPKPNPPTITVPPVPTCAEGSEMIGGKCLPQCSAPMTRDKTKNVCGCPDGTEAKDGACKKKSGFLDDVLGNVHFGIGVGTGNRPRSSGGGPVD